MFPTNSISCMIIMDNNAVIFYYRGSVCKDLNGDFLGNLDQTTSISDTRTLFNRYFAQHEDISFADFIAQYAEAISNSKSIYISFLRQVDYFRIVSGLVSFAKYHHASRISPENNYVALYLSKQLSERYMSENPSLEIASSVNYDNTELGFLFGNGVCEVYTDFKTVKVNGSYDNEKRYLIKSSDNLKLALLRGMIIQHNILTEKEKNLLLLDIVPFDIHFGPQWGQSIPEIIEAGTTIPTRKSDTFDFAGTDFVSVKIGNRIHSIDLIKDFGYAPKEIMCTVQIGNSVKDIRFEVTDKSNGKSKSYYIENLSDLHKNRMAGDQ